MIFRYKEEEKGCAFVYFSQNDLFIPLEQCFALECFPTLSLRDIFCLSWTIRAAIIYLQPPFDRH